MKRVVKFIVIHCSASDLPHQDSIEAVKKLHISPYNHEFRWGNYKANGRAWSDVGYHYFIKKSGEEQKGRDENKIGAHVFGHNKDSIGICVSGDKEFTPEQFQALSNRCKNLCERHQLSKMDIIGHRDLDSKKTCPNFDIHSLVASWDWH